MALQNIKKQKKKCELLLQNQCKETGNINQNSVAYSLYDSSNSALQHFEPYHWLCPGDDILCVFSLQHRWLLSVLSELQDII